MSAEPVVFAVGGSLVAVAAVRSALMRAAVRRQLRTALNAVEPAARVAAVQTAGENGVGRNARLLLAVAEAEEDIWVRQALAQTVIRHRWEPAATETLVRLRIWAKQELLWGQLEAPVVPVVPVVPAVIEAAPLVIEASPVAEAGISGASVQASLSATGWWEE
ncbi:hypothetical protein GCM10009839_31500 [Catenulispora yoronensis]|uniref:Secreted protein n=1 Tax=Catenulispora yoronensis TaxID=450799 RepID=A0ABP5FMT5_9ACTN